MWICETWCAAVFFGKQGQREFTENCVEITAWEIMCERQKRHIYWLKFSTPAVSQSRCSVGVGSQSRCLGAIREWGPESPGLRTNCFNLPWKKREKPSFSLDQSQRDVNNSSLPHSLSLSLSLSFIQLFRHNFVKWKEFIFYKQVLLSRHLWYRSI